MTRLEVIPALRHRGIFCGEISLQPFCARNERLGIPWQPTGVCIGLQYQDWAYSALEELARTTKGVAERPQPIDGAHVTYIEYGGLFYPPDALKPDSYGEIKRGNFKLTHDEGEPFFIYLEMPKGRALDPLDGVHVAMEIDGLAAFVGAVLANVLGHHVTAMLENFNPDDHDRKVYLRFRRMEEYNEMFLNLCELIAHETEEQFDRPAKLREFLDYWTNTEGVVDVPAQLSHYAENGPSKSGETQADYDAEAADFRRLVEAGYLAAEIESFSF